MDNAFLAFNVGTKVIYRFIIGLIPSYWITKNWRGEKGSTYLPNSVIPLGRLNFLFLPPLFKF